MNDFELMVDILKRGRANFDTFQWRGADCIHVYNDVEEVWNLLLMNLVIL